MRRVTPEAAWPDSWKLSYAFDLEEVYGEVTSRGYAYAYATRRRKTLELLCDVLPPGSRVLDVAAAQGNFSLALAEMGYRVTWNDLRGELADYARLKHEHGDIRYAPGDAFEIDFGSAFDGVLITEVIEHVAHPDAFLARVALLVRPGGWIVMTTPNGAYFRNTLPKFSTCSDPSVYEAIQFKPDADGHIFLLHPGEIEPLAAQAGLEVDAMALFTNPLTSGHMKSESLLRVLPRSTVEGAERVSQWLPRVLGERCLLQMGVRFRKPDEAAA